MLKKLILFAALIYKKHVHKFVFNDNTTLIFLELNTILLKAFVRLPQIRQIFYSNNC